MLGGSAERDAGWDRRAARAVLLWLHQRVPCLAIFRLRYTGARLSMSFFDRICDLRYLP